MFLETAIGHITTVLAFLDAQLASPGVGLAFVLSMLAGIAAAQFAKFPLSRAIDDDGWFSWVVRAVSVAAAMIFGLCFPVPMHWTVAALAGLASIGFYHLSLLLIRRKWPWLETKKVVGSVEPPATAFLAAMARREDK